MKTSLFGLAILLVLCSLFGYYISYNYVYHPFVYEDKNILTNYVDDERVENEELFEYFFIDLIDYKRLINQYEYNFTYCDLDGSFIPLFAQETYCDKGYSLIINCNESYEKEYEYYINNLRFIEYDPSIESYINELDVNYFESIIIDNWVFKEIYYNDTNRSHEYYISWTTRTNSLWFGYNDDTNQIIFIYMNIEPSVYLYDYDFLKRQIKYSSGIALD